MEHFNQIPQSSSNTKFKQKPWSGAHVSYMHTYRFGEINGRVVLEILVAYAPNSMDNNNNSNNILIFQLFLVSLTLSAFIYTHTYIYIYLFMFIHLFTFHKRSK